MGDIGLAIQRAEDKTAQMQARAGAIDELLASGALEDHVGGNQDYIQAELDRMGANNEIESELARMRGELEGPGQAPRQIEANGGSAGNPGVSGNSAQPQQQPGNGEGL